MRHRSTTTVAALGVFILATGWNTPSGADEASVRREDQLKAAYLFNFVKFVEWPAGAAGQHLTVCFLGGEGAHVAFTAGVRDKKVGPHSLLTRRMEPSGSASGCNVLYIDARAAGGDWPALLSGAKAVLTVSDAGDFIRKGGVIELFTERNRLRFNINLDNAHKEGLRVSSSLLQLAAAVEKGGAT